MPGFDIVVSVNGVVRKVLSFWCRNGTVSLAKMDPQV